MNGWYYDLQLKNPLTSVSLHPNQKITNTDVDDGFGVIPYEWGDFGENECDEDYYFRSDGDEPRGCGYSKSPIASAIISEDFNVSVANQWTPVGGDGGVSQIWNSIRGSSPYLPVVMDLLKEGGQYFDEAEDKNRQEGNDVTATIAHVGGNIFDTISGVMSGINNSDRLNQNLVIQNTRFSYYAGSGTAFNNLALRYTIFPKWEYKNDDNGNVLAEYKSVTDQIKDLLPYCNGYFEESSLKTTIDFILSLFSSTTNEGVAEIKGDMKTIKSKITDWKNKIFKRKDEYQKDDGEGKKKIVDYNKLKGVIEEVTERNLEVFHLTIDDIDRKFSGIISWQHAPGGYIPSFKDIDKPQKGTLKLRIGTQYSIHSLLCNDISLNFSKILVKDKNNKHDPLYCDVNITLAPATKFSNKMLEQFVGLVNKDSYNKGNFRKNELSEFDDNLIQMQKNLDSYFRDESIRLNSPIGLLNRAEYV